MIKLEQTEIDFIKQIKGHYQEKYPFVGEWTETFKPIFEKIYGYGPDENYDMYLQVLFNKLLKIYVKIKEDGSDLVTALSGVFEVTFYKSITRSQEQPIERAISELCGMIQSTSVIKDGKERFVLN